MMNSILFAGGGSGGHLFPGVAVAEELLRQSPETRFQFVGSERDIEWRILSRAGFDHVALPVCSSSGLLKAPLSFASRNWRAYRMASDFLKRHSPHVVVGLGGFASVPVVLAARRIGIPVVLMEQNAVLGRANRFLLPWANRICLSYDQTPVPARYAAKIRCTGNPLRSDVACRVMQRTKRQDEPLTLAVLGGSQGASAVNDAFLLVLPNICRELQGWRVIHQTGDRQFADVQSQYTRLGIDAEVSPFLEDMGSVYPHLDMVISRAGGTTLAELAMHGVPGLLIPYPKSMRDHQLRNAERVAQAGGGVVVSQSSQSGVTAMRLEAALMPLLTGPKLRESMQIGMRTLAKPNAHTDVADVILQYSPTREMSNELKPTHRTVA